MELQARGWTLVSGIANEEIRQSIVSTALESRKVDRITNSISHRSKTDLEAWNAGEAPLSLRLSDAILSLICDKRLGEEMRACLGESNLFVHLAPSLRVVERDDFSALVPIHNDLFYNGHLKLRNPKNGGYPFLTCWIALQGSSSTHGGLGVSIVSRDYAYGEDETQLGNLADGKQLIKHKIEVVPYSEGDAVIFCPWLVHGSVGHSSATPRISLDFRFFGPNTTTNRHYAEVPSLTRFEPGTGPNRE